MGNGSIRVPWTRAEAAELYALVIQAWELRETPYLLDACQAIVDWHGRLPLARLERRKGSIGSLVRLLRETDPDRITARRSPA